MKLCRLLAPDWLINESPGISRVVEGLFTMEQLKEFNEIGYHIYYLPNHPKTYQGGSVEGKDIDSFEYVFVDCDLKDGFYKSKEEFLEKVLNESQIPPTLVTDSGNGIHCYWKVTDLDSMSYLRFQRRLMRLFHTDEAVGQIFQLMRLPGFYNTKNKADKKLCYVIVDDDVSYTSEQLDKLLPKITMEDEKYCQQHYNRTNGIEQIEKVNEKIPSKFWSLVDSNNQVKELFTQAHTDRSKSDFRLALIMKAHNYSVDEAMSVLYNTAKAMQRAPSHRFSYAKNIVDKIWVAGETTEAEPKPVDSSPTVREILAAEEGVIKGTRFPCHKLVDDTEYGFRLGQVIGIIGGSGVGKTTLTLNMFLWFAAHNPDCHHFFFSLEQPASEIAVRIRTICGDNDSLFDRIHIVSNYGSNGDEYKNYSLTTIEEHLISFKDSTKHKIGATVIDHIGVLDKQLKNGENDGLIGVCRQMKSVAVKVDTMLIMLSQTSKEKAGIGDLELDKGAAYGTVAFESYVDYCITLWQPLKRMYAEQAPTIMAFKFVKIRHKRQGKDRIQEDVRYQVFFDPSTERLRELTQEEEVSVKYFMTRAANDRKQDRKTEVLSYVSRRIEDATSTDS